jgi:hypothetical protein
LNTSASAVQPIAGSLNSGDTFVLIAGADCIVWYGNSSNEEERAFASNVAGILGAGRQIHQIAEGAEPDQFWQFLGGQSEYAQLKESTDLQEPRLFVANGVTGNFILEEVFNFSQDDLQQDSVVILDAGTEVFIWIGHDARQDDKKHAMQVALDYVSNAPDGRSADTPVFAVSAGSEPPTFTSHFHGWNDKQAVNFTDPYKEKLKQIQASSGVNAGKDESKFVASNNTTSINAGAKPVVNRITSSSERVTAASVAPATSSNNGSAAAPSVGSGFADPNKTRFSHAELSAGVPAGVDPKLKELYLSDAEFQSLFKMDKAAFAKLAAWKKGEVKKGLKLF